MKRTIGVAEIEGDSLHLAVFEIRGQRVSLVTEESLGPGESSRFPGLDVWLIVRTRDRSIRYVTLPKVARRQAASMAMLQASPYLLHDADAYAHDALVKPVGDGLGALVVAIPLDKARAWEERLEAAGLVLVSFAVEPLFYPLVRAPEPGRVMFCMPTPQGSLAIVGCRDGPPVCWETISDESQIPAGGLKNMLVQEYFCEAPEPFTPDKVLGGEPSIEPRLVGYLAAAHLAAMRPRPWEGRSLLTFREFLQREQYAPATWRAIARCAAVWAVVAALLLIAGTAHVIRTERRAEEMMAAGEQLRVFARQSTQAAQEVGDLMALRYRLQALTVDKVMVLDVLRRFQEALPYRVRLTALRYDVASGVQAECLAEQEPDILILLGRIRRLPSVRELRLLFAEKRDDGLFHFRLRFHLGEESGGASEAGSPAITSARTRESAWR